MRDPLLLAAILPFLLPAPADAGEWMFCVVTSSDYRSVMITDVFEARRPRDVIEESLVAARRARGVPVVAQCPLGNSDRGVVAQDQARAFAFNRTMGNTVEGPVAIDGLLTPAFPFETDPRDDRHHAAVIGPSVGGRS